MKTDTRQLRRRDGRWKAGGQPLCLLCSAQDTCTWRAQHGDVESCHAMIPAFGFMNEVGLDRISNTMRVGKAWSERLVTGDRVGLYNVKRKEMFGSATILSVFTGPIVPMLIKHAHANHTMLDTPRAEAAEMLLRWMRQNYGPRLINKQTHLTAVYLLNDNGKPLTTPFQAIQTARDDQELAEGAGHVG